MCVFCLFVFQYRRSRPLTWWSYLKRQFKIFKHSLVPLRLVLLQNVTLKQITQLLKILNDTYLFLFHTDSCWQEPVMVHHLTGTWVEMNHTTHNHLPSFLQKRAVSSIFISTCQIMHRGIYCYHIHCNLMRLKKKVSFPIKFMWRHRLSYSLKGVVFFLAEPFYKQRNKHKNHVPQIKH